MTVFIFLGQNKPSFLAIIKTKSATTVFFSLLLLSSSSLCHFLLCFSFLGVILELISAVSARAQQRSTEPAFGRLFTQMTVKFVTFLKKKRLLFVASNSGKRYWDWTLLRIRAQIELSSTSVYDYKMSTSGIRSSPRGDEWQWCPCLWTELHHSAK